MVKQLLLKYFKMKIVKTIFLLFILTIISCKKRINVPDTTNENKNDIFKNEQVTVTNGQNLQFYLDNRGQYTLTLFDSVQNQVVSREKINGVSGTNNFKIYTKSLQTNYLYLILRDSINNQIGKTTIFIK